MTWATSTSRSFRMVRSRRRSMRWWRSGVAYFSSAGNNGTLAYDNNAPSFATAGTGQNAGEHLLNFDHGRRRRSTTTAAGHDSADDSGRIRRDCRGMGSTLRDRCAAQAAAPPIKSTCASPARPAMTSSTTGQRSSPTTCSGAQRAGSRSGAGDDCRQSCQCHRQQLSRKR